MPLSIYNLGGIEMMSYIMAPMVVGFIISPFIIQKLLKRIEGPTLFLYNGIASILVWSIYFIVGYENSVFVLIISVFFGFCFSIGMTLSTVYLLDSEDYAEWKTGYRAEGLMFATQSLILKIMSAFSSFIVGLLLTMIGSNNDLATQTASTNQGIFFVLSGGISLLLDAIPLMICKYKGKQKGKILYGVI